MTTAAINVSVKVPRDLFDLLPQAGRGRSQFILDAIAEKAERQKPAKWVPQTERGKRMMELWEKGREERGRPMTREEIEQEIVERRGRQF